MRKLPRSSYIHSRQVCRHAPANSPNVRRIALLEHPVALHLIAQVDDPTCMTLPFFGSEVGQLRQGLCRGNANTDRDTCPPINLGTDLSTQALKVARHARELGEGFVDAVHLCCGHHGLDD
ncbi:hypothetical protein D3C81_1453880 [compost metagenome]